MTTVFHLIRHGRHTLQGRVMVGRSQDVHLAEEGRREAERAADWLARAGLDVLYSSPLDRARQTADAIGRRTGLSAAIEQDANEVDFGIWTGLTVEALRAHPDWPGPNAKHGVTYAPDGESPRQVQTRCVALIERLCARHPGERIALVFHGDPILTSLAHFLGMPLDRIGHLEVSTGSISTIAFGPLGHRVMRINLLPEAVGVMAETEPA